MFPNGKTDVPDEGESARVISDGIAYEVTDILKGVITAGTGAGYTDIGCPAAGKTGTTEGYVRRLVRRLHAEALDRGLGRAPDVPQPSTGLRRPHAGPIWHSYMEAAHGSYCDDFPPPQNPVQFSNWSEWVAPVSAPSTRSFGGTSKPAPPSGAKNNGKYPPAYAPGAGQGPAPTPPAGARRRRLTVDGRVAFVRAAQIGHGGGAR